MFDSLSDRLGGVFDRLRGRGALTEADVRAAMREDSRLLVIEPLALAGDQLALSIDLMMLVLSTGRVRTEPEMAALLAAAGLRMNRVITTRMYPVVVATLA